MLDDEKTLPPIGTLIELAARQWRIALQQGLAQRGAPFLGAAGELLPLVPAGGIGQAALTQQTGLTKQAVQQLLDQLERQGLVVREPDPLDRRAKRVVITLAGQRALADRGQAEREAEKAVRKGLGRERYDRLRKGLRRLTTLSASSPAPPDPDRSS